jgi:hypothetical protein
VQNHATRTQYKGRQEEAENDPQSEGGENFHCFDELPCQSTAEQLGTGLSPLLLSNYVVFPGQGKHYIGPQSGHVQATDKLQATRALAIRVTGRRDRGLALSVVARFLSIDFEVTLK